MQPESYEDPTFPDSSENKLVLIERVQYHRFAGLNHENSGGSKARRLWVVMASRFSLKSEWDFPIVGSVPYKGFFNKERAIKLRDEL